jgi:hypothetical protein
MEFSHFIGYIVFMIIFTMGFWLMIFLAAFVVPYWLIGNFMEDRKLKRAAKKQKA